MATEWICFFICTSTYFPKYRWTKCAMLRMFAICVLRKQAKTTLWFVDPEHTLSSLLRPHIQTHTSTHHILLFNKKLFLLLLCWNTSFISPNTVLVSVFSVPVLWTISAGLVQIMSCSLFWSGIPPFQRHLTHLRYVTALRDIVLKGKISPHCHTLHVWMQIWANI